MQHLKNSNQLQQLLETISAAGCWYT